MLIKTLVQYCPEGCTVRVIDRYLPLTFYSFRNSSCIQ